MSFDSYMIDEIAVEPFIDDDNVDQVPSYDARVVYRARIEETLRTIRLSTGELVDVATAVATNATVTARDRVWIAPFVSRDAPRVFPPGFVFVDADARSPIATTNARKMGGGAGHTEFFI